MAAIKTQKNDVNVLTFLESVKDEIKRKDGMTLLAMMKKLGKYKTSVSCLYINKLADVDSKVLIELITVAYKDMKEKYK